MITLRRQGIRWRLAMLYLGIFAAGLSVFCALLFQYFQRTQIEAFDSTLYNFAVDINANLEMDFVGRLFVLNSTIPEAGKFLPFHLGAIFIEIRDTNGKILMHSKALRERQLPLDQGTLGRVLRDKFDFQTLRPGSLGLSHNEPDHRLLTFLASRSDWREPLILQIAVPMDLPRQERRHLLLFFALGIPIFLIIAGVAGVWLSKYAMQPVHDMTLKAAAITGVENLRERIPVPEAEDEIHELAETFNSLLDRLDSAFASQDRFVSNASHQLKTPLTILKNELHVLRKAYSQGENLGPGLDSAADEVQRLILLVQDLLLLARLEAGKDTIAMLPVRIDEVVMQVVARLQKLATEKQLRLRTQVADLEMDLEVEGDEELLDSMLENFVENAIKYAPSGTDIELTLRPAPEGVELSVRDHGPGVSEELKQKMFERFSRGKPSNEIPGSGLGLSIAAEIARIHNVKIDLSTPQNGPGMRVTLTFPRTVNITKA